MPAAQLPWTTAIHIAVGAALLAVPAAAAEVEIGAVFQPEFNGALGRLTTGTQRDLRFGETVYLDEEVLTGPESSTAILFLDETRLQIGANSRIVLDRYVFDPASGEGEAIIQFGQGIFRYISGGMPEDQITLRTPTAVMAIRGTTLIVYVAPDNSTQVAVIDGAVDVSPCGAGPLHATAGYSAVVSADCTESAVVPGVVTPPDPAVIADLDFTALSPAAGPTPHSGDRDRGRNRATAGRLSSPDAGSGGIDAGGGDPSGGPGGGDPGDGGDAGGPGNGNGNDANSGNGGGNTGGSGPGTGNGGSGHGRGGNGDAGPAQPGGGSASNKG